MNIVAPAATATAADSAAADGLLASELLQEDNPSAASDVTH